MEFVVELRVETYNANTGWLCPALTIPGATLKNIVIGGKSRSLDDFKVEGFYIRKLQDAEKPEDGAATIVLRKRLFSAKAPVASAAVTAIVTTVGAVAAAWISHPKDAHAKCQENPRLEIVLDKSTRTLTTPSLEKRSAVALGSCGTSKLTYCVELDQLGRVPIPWNGISIGSGGKATLATVTRVPSKGRIKLSNLTLLKHGHDGLHKVGNVGCSPVAGGFRCKAHDDI